MRLSIMFRKQKWLTMNGENLGKIYANENKTVILLSATKVRGENGGRNMKISANMLLQTHGGKMPVFGLAIILMKRHGL